MKVTEEDSEWEDCSEDEDTRNIITVNEFVHKRSSFIDSKFGHKVGCIFPIVIVPILPHTEFGPNDHRNDALHFSFRCDFMNFVFCDQTQPTANRVVSDSEWIESDEDQIGFDNNDRIDLRFNYGLIPWDRVVKMTQTFRFDQYIFNLLWLDCRWTHNQWDSCGRFFSTRPTTSIGSWRKNNHH